MNDMKLKPNTALLSFLQTPYAVETHIFAQDGRLFTRSDSNYEQALAFAAQTCQYISGEEAQKLMPPDPEFLKWSKVIEMPSKDELEVYGFRHVAG